MNRRSSLLILSTAAVAAFAPQLSLTWLTDTSWRALPPVLGGAVLMAVGFGRRNYPLAMMALWLIAASMTLIDRSPYRTGATPLGVIVGLLGASAFCLTWSVARRTRRAPVAGHSYSPSRLNRTIAVLYIAGLAGAFLKYRSGVPLLSGTIDVARAEVRQSASLLVGILNECWTVGAWISGAAVAGVGSLRRSRRSLVLPWVLFMIGLSLGGSRNAIAIGLGVPALAYLDQARRRRSTRQLLGVATGALLAFALLFGFAGQRVVNGTGRFETDFRARSGTTLVEAGLGMAELTFTSPFETLGRVVETDAGRERGLGRYVTHGVAFIYRPLIAGRNSNDVTTQLSAPYFMNVATFIAAPILDVGVPLGLAAVAMLGGGVGIAERSVRRTNDPKNALLLGLLLYNVLFALYEGLAFVYATPWVQAALLLGALRLSRRRHSLVSQQVMARV